MFVIRLDMDVVELVGIYLLETKFGVEPRVFLMCMLDINTNNFCTAWSFISLICFCVVPKMHTFPMYVTTINLPQNNMLLQQCKVTNNTVQIIDKKKSIK